MEPPELTAHSLFIAEPKAIRPADFAGQYRFTHDGWPGVLSLQDTGSRIVRGTYTDSRLDQHFDVTGRIDTRFRHRIEFVIRDFNWLPEQRFVGYRFTTGSPAIAGTTRWKEMPFGFIAAQTEPLPRETYRAGDVEPADFTGSYDIHHDGRSGTIELAQVSGQRLAGTYRSAALDPVIDVTAIVGGEAPNEICMTLVDPASAPPLTVSFTGYLFSRPKNAIAGWAERDQVPMGFYMTRRS